MSIASPNLNMRSGSCSGSAENGLIHPSEERKAVGRAGGGARLHLPIYPIAGKLAQHALVQVVVGLVGG